MSDHHSDDDAKSVDAGAEAAELVEIPMAKAAGIGKGFGGINIFDLKKSLVEK